jgi:hypothetical protein
MNEFSQSVPDPFCKSNLWISQENWCEKIDDFVENRKKTCAMVRHCRSTKSNDLSDFCFFLIHPDVAEISAVFSHGSSLLFF